MTSNTAANGLDRVNGGTEGTEPSAGSERAAFGDKGGHGGSSGVMDRPEARSRVPGALLSRWSVGQSIPYTQHPGPPSHHRSSPLGSPSRLTGGRHPRFPQQS